MLTDKQYKALRVLQENPGITAMRFAALNYTEPRQQYLFTAVSNSGNGAGRYGLKAFAEDALLMQSNFNVKIVSAIAKDRDGIAVKADYNWELHGHVKPVRGIEQLVCFSIQDKTEILIL